MSSKWHEKIAYH